MGRIKHMGYIAIYKPEHPYAAQNGYVREHRLVMEEYLSRILLPKEHIHHINHIKTDNRIENLRIVTPKEHQLLHHKGRKQSSETKKKLSEYRLGTKHSKETKAKMTQTRLGKLREKLQANNTTGFKNVWFNKRTNRFQVYLTLNKKRKYIGTFKTAQEGYKAYQKELMNV